MTRDDSGFTLVELLIVCALVPLILMIVGGLVSSATRTNASVQQNTQAASASQVALESITTASRQADWVSVSGGGTLLRVRTALVDDRNAGALQWTCAAWWIGDGKLYQQRSASSIAAPTNAAAQGWTLLVDGVGADGASPYFSYAAGSVAVTFTVDTGNRQPLLVATTVANRQTNVDTSGKCT
jgi:prepilin-type N-terminal cleavage/methylation domain-containing protein